MQLKPATVTVSRFGNGAGILVPAVLARAMGFEPGTTWKACLAEGEPFFEAEARKLAGRVGILLPADLRRTRGIEVGAELAVPFLAWKLLKR
ncbi:MAG: hypothetical protein LC620_02040 [Halobacteriales archaeon]|nr:hypothetical protein [Halobacteriales archaeon]